MQPTNLTPSRVVLRTNHVLATALALALGAAASSNAFAAPTVVDPVAETLKRLKMTPANRTADGYILTGVRLKSEISTTGLQFTMPSVVPEIPKVLMQNRIANCNTLDVTGRADVSEAIENSETFSKSMTIGSTTTLEVSYQSPVGLGGSASQSLEISGTKGEEKTQAKTVTWNTGLDVPVPAKHSLLWQFVVASKELRNIPWSTNAVVGGAVDLAYSKEPGQVTVCLHEHSSYKGKKRCFATAQPMDLANFKDLKWESGGGNLNDEVTAVEIRGNAKVTLFQHVNYGGWNVELGASSGNVGKDRNDKFSSMKIAPQGSTKVVAGNLDTLLTEQQRRITLSGVYNGVNGVMGDFRAASPVPLTEADCRPVPAGNNVAAGAQAARATAPQAMIAKAPGGGLAVAPIQGARILKASVAPTAQTVTKSSPAKK
jgi:hypothetical protein